MSRKKNNTRHLYHLVNASPWPLLVSFSLLAVVSGIAFYMHKVAFGGYFTILALICLSYCAFFWFCDIIDEATHSGYHTLVVRKGLRLGFLLFIVSEIMLFFGFFWAFFHGSLSPALEIGSIYPPDGIRVINPFGFPLYNTAILIISGLSVTWAHYSLAMNHMKELIDAFCITILLGIFFVFLQMFEYYETAFNFSDSVYACSFFMLTGLHGFHVIVGVSFLSVCFVRLTKRHYMLNHYSGFVFAIWYWHFVDIVWIFLYVTVYLWGNWQV